MLTKQLAHFQVPVSSGQCEGRYSFLVRKKKKSKRGEDSTERGISVNKREDKQNVIHFMHCNYDLLLREWAMFILPRYLNGWGARC